MNLPVLLQAAIGCAPGVLSGPAGDEPMRSALYVLQAPDDAEAIGVDRALVLLSNGDVACDPIEAGDDWQAAEVDLYTALGREGARHVWIELYKTEFTSWEGRYAGGGDTPISDVAAGLGLVRAASGYAFSIDEATVTEEDGLYQTFQPTKVSGGEMDLSSWVEVDAFEPGETDGPVSISFEIPPAGIGGMIRHLTRCDPDSYAFQMLAGCSVDDLIGSVAGRDDDEWDVAALLDQCSGG